jgi:hypothetical protein
LIAVALNFGGLAVRVGFPRDWLGPTHRTSFSLEDSLTASQQRRQLSKVLNQLWVFLQRGRESEAVDLRSSSEKRAEKKSRKRALQN